MNKNPEGTPNPLNPNPVEPAAAPETIVQETTVAVSEPEMVAPESGNATATETPEPKPAKKSKKVPFIITAIILLLVAVGCGAAAIFVLKPLNQDAVPAAISKLFNSRPDYILTKGSVSVEAESMNLDTVFISGIDNKNHQNYVDATITADLGDKKDIELKINEVHTSTGNLYLKLSGIIAAIEKFTATEMESTEKHVECISAEDCNIEDPDGLDLGTTAQLDPLILNSLGMIDVIDGEWIQIPDSTFSSVSGLGVLNDAPAQCLIDAAGTVGKYSDDLANIYKNNQFITYSTDNLAIASKQDTLYRLGFDVEKMADFINAMGNSGFVNELRACMGATATNAKVDTDALATMLEELPEIYVEIDNDNNFTRVYLALDYNEVSFKADFSFSYPSSVEVEEPELYISFNDLLSQVLGNFFGTDAFNVEEE